MTRLNTKVPAYHTGTGTVLVKEDGKTLGRGTLDDRGMARVALGRLEKGKHTVLVAHQGDGHNKPAESEPITFKVR